MTRLLRADHVSQLPDFMQAILDDHHRDLPPHITIGLQVRWRRTLMLAIQRGHHLPGRQRQLHPHHTRPALPVK